MGNEKLRGKIRDLYGIEESKKIEVDLKGKDKRLIDLEGIGSFRSSLLWRRSS